MKKLKKAIFLLCIMVMILALLTGCGGGSGGNSGGSGGGNSGGGSGGGATTSGGSSGAHRDDVIIALPDEPSSLNCMNSPQTATSLVTLQVCESLVLTDETGINVSPLLATSWEFNDVGDQILFTLRDDVYFHNGEKFTADDVVFSYHENLRLGIMETTIAYYDHMEKIDDTHVRLYLKQPFANIMACVGATDCGIVSKKAYEENGVDGFGRNPIGTGPYKFVEWKTGDYIKLTANENYYGKAPAIKNVTYKIFSDDSAASLALQNKEIDVCYRPPAIDRDRIANTPGLTLQSGIGLNHAWMFFGYHEGSHFIDENVRLAVAYAIDKDAVALGATDGVGIPSHSSLFGEWWGYTSPGYLCPQNDIAKAKELMAKSAYPNGFNVDVVTTNNPNYYRTLEVIQPMLAEIGINISISKVDQGIWNTDVFHAGNYEINAWQASMSFPDFNDHVPCWRSGAFLNAGNMSDPYVDELLDAQDLAPTEEERVRIIRTVDEYLYDHALLIPLFTYPNFVAHNSDLQGIIVATQMGNLKVYQWSWAN